jgi:hypothetical protein
LTASSGIGCGFLDETRVLLKGAHSGGNQEVRLHALLGRLHGSGRGERRLVGQEPGWDSPFNLGAHCAKGASVREHATASAA